MVDVLERPSAEFETAAAPQRPLTVQIDADLMDWLAARGADAALEINGLLRFYKESNERIESQFQPDGWEPGEMQTPPPAPPAP